MNLMMGKEKVFPFLPYTSIAVFFGEKNTKNRILLDVANLYVSNIKY